MSTLGSTVPSRRAIRGSIGTGIPGARPAWTRAEAEVVVCAPAVAFVLMLLGSAQPSFWFDEAATISGASRDLPSLWNLLQHVDAVHGLYYVAMHGLLAVAPPTEFVLRLPSAIAVAATVPMAYLIGRRLASRTVGAIGAIMFLVLPRTTWMATEARSFALATLLASLLVLVVLVTLERGGWWRYLLVAVIAVAGTLLFVYVVLLVAALGLSALFARVSRARRAWVIGALALAVVLSAPFIAVVASQEGQLGGVKPVGRGFPRYFLIDQFFMEQKWVALGIAALCVLLALVGFLRRRRGRPLPVPFLRERFGAVLLASWLLLPPAAIAAVSLLLGRSIYQPRALAFTAPAVALLIACLIAWTLKGWWRHAAVAVLVVASAPAYFQARTDTAKEFTDWRLAAELIASEATPGTAVVYVGNDAVPEAVNQQPWAIATAYPSAVAGLADPLLIRPAGQTAGLWDERRPSSTAGDVVTQNRVLVVRGVPDDAPESAAVADSLQRAGFHLDSTNNLLVTHTEVWVRERGRGLRRVATRPMAALPTRDVSLTAVSYACSMIGV